MKFSNLTLSLVLLLMNFAAPCLGQEAKQLSFQGAVQFTQGSVARILGSKKSDGSFGVVSRDPIHEGDRFVLEKDSYLKILSKDLCVYVFYGPGQIVAPSKSEFWRTSTKTWRLICNEGSGSVQDRDLKVQLASKSEIFVAEPKPGDRWLAVRTGQAMVNSKSLPSSAIYSVNSIEKLEINENVQHRFLTSAPIPSEALAVPDLKIPEVEVKEETRTRYELRLGALIGGNAQIKTDQEKLSEDEANVDGEARVSLGLRSKWGSWLRPASESHSLMTWSLVSRRLDSYNSKSQNYFFQSIYSKSEALLAEVGFRGAAERWWSWTARFGMGEEILRTYQKDYNAEYGFLVATAGFGVDFRASFWNSFGLALGVELCLTQSLGSPTKNEIKYYGSSFDVKAPETLRTFAPMMWLSLFYKD